MSPHKSRSVSVFSAALLLLSAVLVLATSPFGDGSRSANRIESYRRSKLGALASSPAGQAPVIAFTNVNVVPLDRPRVLSRRTVLIRNGSIARVGRSRKVRVPEDAIVIEGRGRYLMPGLIDAHVHLSHFAELLLYVANGVTTVREMWGSPGHVNLRDSLAAGEEFGPSMVVASPGFVGPNPVFSRAIVVTNRDQARRAFTEQVQVGYDFLKIHERLGAEPYEAILAAALENDVAVIGHVPGPVGVDRVLSSPAQVSISHFSRFSTSINTPSNLSWTGTIDQQRMDSLAARIGDLGIYNDPTLVTLRYALNPLERQEFLRREELRYLPQQLIDHWMTRPPWTNPATREVKLSNEMIMLKALADADAPLLLGTDGGFDFLIPGFTMHEELELYVAAGLTPFQALQAATVRSGEFLGLSRELGPLKKGRRADLVLLRQNPLDNIRNIGRIAGVMVRGEWFSRKTLNRLLEEQAKELER